VRVFRCNLFFVYFVPFCGNEFLILVLNLTFKRRVARPTEGDSFNA
jgi:hypothetical protein